jgi:hypothetical protein
MGALVGAIVGAIGGLFAVGIAPAVLSRDPTKLFSYPKIALICFLVSGTVAWILGGQIGPRLGELSNARRGEIIGGILGGLLPVAAIGWWGWYMVTPH